MKLNALHRFSLFPVLLALAGALPAEGAPSAPGSKISPERAKELLASGAGAVLMDVRTAEEYAGGHIEGAKLLPYDEIDPETSLAVAPSKESAVVVYCRSGRRSAIAARTLVSLGYRNVLDLGGISGWPYGLVK